ncbi:MAG: DUF3570 domain-containing protein [Pseudomonadota bacterium]
MSKSESKKLLALTAAAMSLPGYAPQAQAWSDAESETGYRFTHYAESDLSATATNQRNRERYTVLSHQFHLRVPDGEARQYTGDLTVETMSGASPWFIVPAADGKPIQVMSGATIDDSRMALELGRTDFETLGSRSYSLGFSREEDYLSLGGGYGQSWELNDRLTVFDASLRYSRDFLKPTDGETARFPDRVKYADKGVASVSAGVSQALSADSTVQLSLSYGNSEGYLSDPYKKVLVGNKILPDQRPGQRNQFSLSARLRQYWSRFAAALHLDGVASRDDWGVATESLEAGWYQRVWNDWLLAPSVRWYQQGEADFHRPYFSSAPDDANHSSDYRLSTFGALSYRLGVLRDGPQWSFAFAAERYDSDPSYSLRDADLQNPGLVTFTVYSAALSYKF